jgi:CheY-like chemotaxis protein
MMAETLPTLRPARRVLVIDDEEALCVLLARMLGKWGYKVITSNLAKSAHLEEMTESDIIFIDMKMPEMDGLQVIDFLISHQIKSSIILMSGQAIEDMTTAEEVVKHADLRLIGVLDKPFRERDVLAIMEAD